MDSLARVWHSPCIIWNVEGKIDGYLDECTKAVISFTVWFRRNIYIAR